MIKSFNSLDEEGKDILSSLYYNINYSIFSTLEPSENDRYCQKIIGTIEGSFEDSNDMIPVGCLEAYKILLSVAADNNYSAEDVFDNEHCTMEIGSAIYDFKKNEWNENMNTYFDYDLWNSDVLILSRVEILPGFRGKGLATKAIKDLYNNFIQGCGIFALKCFPLQHEINGVREDDLFRKQMQYNLFETDYKKAFQHLSKFYKKIGFENIPGISKEIMVINPSIRNKKFQSIKLE